MNRLLAIGMLAATSAWGGTVKPELAMSNPGKFSLKAMRCPLSVYELGGTRLTANRLCAITATVYTPKRGHVGLLVANSPRGHHARVLHVPMGPRAHAVFTLCVRGDIKPGQHVYVFGSVATGAGVLSTRMHTRAVAK